ncbi:hypothetical protein K7G98_39955, partial [Saccharothrix sp. MB29]|nr:hypothetical protein [Saccharothrix sp. MB29]
AAMGGAAAGATAVGTTAVGTAGVGTAGAVASAPQWLAVAASTTALVVAVVWGVGSNGGPPEPTTDALPPTLSADLQQPAPTADSTAPTAA